MLLRSTLPTNCSFASINIFIKLTPFLSFGSYLTSYITFLVNVSSKKKSKTRKVVCLRTFMQKMKRFRFRALCHALFLLLL